MSLLRSVLLSCGILVALSPALVRAQTASPAPEATIGDVLQVVAGQTEVLASIADKLGQIEADASYIRANMATKADATKITDKLASIQNQLLARPTSTTPTLPVATCIECAPPAAGPAAPAVYTYTPSAMFAASPTSVSCVGQPFGTPAPSAGGSVNTCTDGQCPQLSVASRRAQMASGPGGVSMNSRGLSVSAGPSPPTPPAPTGLFGRCIQKIRNRRAGY